MRAEPRAVVGGIEVDRVGGGDHDQAGRDHVGEEGSHSQVEAGELSVLAAPAAGEQRGGIQEEHVDPDGCGQAARLFHLQED